MEESFSKVLGQPREISLLIGSFMTPKELARAQMVSKAWYCTFGHDSLWKRFLPPSMLSNLSSPPKLEAIRQSLLKEMWHRGAAERKAVPLGIHTSGGVISPDGSWVLTFGGMGRVVLMTQLKSPSPNLNMIAGSGVAHDPHDSTDIHGGLISSDGHVFTFGERGYVVKWTGFDTNKISGTLVAGKGLSCNPHASESIHKASISPDGRWAITGGSLGCLVFWKNFGSTTPYGIAIAGKETENDFHQSCEISGCSISSDGSWALTIGGCVTVLWRGLLSGNITGTILRDPIHNQKLNKAVDCAISSNSSWALSMGELATIIRWRDLNTNQWYATVPWTTPPFYCSFLSFS